MNKESKDLKAANEWLESKLQEQKRQLVRMERELQIEAALERVRTRAMAMQKSDELAKAAELLYHEFGKLGIDTFTCGYLFIDEKKDVQTAWVVLPDGALLPNYIDFPLTGDHVMDERYKAWKEKKLLHICELKGEENKQHHQFLSSHVPSFVVEDIFSHIPNRIIFYCANFSNGYLFIISTEFLSPEEEQTIIRFAKVFEMTYTRFNDLKQAEAQARQAQIETALEKIRSRSLGMHHSVEIKEVVSILFEKLKELNLVFDGGAAIHLFSEGSRNAVIWVAAPDLSEPTCINLPYDENAFENNPIIKDVWDAKENGEHIYNKFYSFEEKNIYFEYVFKHNDFITLPKLSRDFILQADSYTATFIAEKNSLLGANSWTRQLFSDNDFEVLNGIARVFEQAYIRFLDLQKAEAQAREAQISAALERIRNRTLLMKDSNELSDAAVTLFQEFKALGLVAASDRTYFLTIHDEKTYSAKVWITRTDGKTGLESFYMPLNTLQPLINVYEGWERKEPLIIRDLTGDELMDYLKLLASIQALKEEKDYQQTFVSPPQRRVIVDATYSHGTIGIVSDKPFLQETLDILVRFAKVFEFTYARFLDLQRAEAQAREAKIELALESVRSRTMAMQKSQELGDISFELVKHVQSLGIATWHCAFNIYDEDQNSSTEWGSNAGGTYPKYKTPRAGIFRRYYEIGQTGETFHVEVIGEDRCADHYAYLCTLPGVGEQLLKLRDSGVAFPTSQIDNLAYFNYGYLLFITYEQVPEAHEIFKRFAKVFEQTYTRFLDIQKAEAQALEAQIEASLERVRSRTMAMHNSEDVTSATETMFDELKKLGIDNLRCGIAHIHHNKTFDVFGVTNLADGNTMSGFGFFGMDEHPIWQRWFESWKNKEEVFIAYIAGQEKEEYFNNINNHHKYLPQKIAQFPDSFFQAYYFEQGAVWAYSLFQHSEPEKEIMKRFATGFSLTFRRYQDLKKAETQAREARIEAALEKVRGKAMAMHNSNDLTATASLVFTELRKLGITSIRSGVGLLTKKTRKVILYSASSSKEEDNLSLVGWAMLQDHPVLTTIYDSWISNEDYFPVLKGELLKSYYKKIFSNFALPGSHYEHNLPDSAITDANDEQHGHFLAFSEGFLYVWSEKPYTQTEIGILHRFKLVIDLTFRRYIELQKSEANAREAVKQSALDRIRADIASMRTISDLDRITPLIWNELTILGIPFIRCGVFIMDDALQLIHTFLSSPDGKAIAAFHLSYDTPGNIAQVIDHWHNKRVYVDYWDKKAFTAFAESLVSQGALKSSKQYLSTLPVEGFHLHFLPFLQGMFYVGNTSQLNEEELKLIQLVADAFSTAYARYEDFYKLEAAKQQVEDALQELKSTQSQLIQREKMASLGELTAGIAHEIQNPLNFVNNFSEVSVELLEELKQEAIADNKAEVLALVENLLQNLEKIHNHGTRADSIVKGMLQHSRSSSGEKQLTDINGLVDEYLRLAYHGLRAKEKDFNVNFRLEADSTLGKLEVVPQELGRVLLNLFNNAFYATQQKKARLNGQFQPQVIVTTKAFGDKVEIRVKDNGAGIPEHIKQKIFQPFFTTKSAGEGTGLGLSLSYDIITKGHGGELKVESREGEFTTLIIVLPKNDK